jgi:predicted HicB family RNase H-like nuclease
MPAVRGPRRGARQRKALAAPAADPEALVAITVRLPDRLRHKAHQAAAALNMSTNEYVTQLLEQAPMPEPAQEPLPLAETA